MPCMVAELCEVIPGCTLPQWTVTRLNRMIFRRLSLLPEDVSAGCDGNYGSPKIDSAAVDYGTGAVGLDDLIFRHTNLPPDEFRAERRIYMA